MALTEARAESILQGMTAISLKVLDCLMFETPVNRGEICRALKQKGIQASPHIVDGCLTTLEESGLARQVAPWTYVRVRIKTKPRLTVVTPEEPMAAPATPAVMLTLSERIERLQKQVETLRDDAIHIGKQLGDLAVDAIEYGKDDPEIANLRQLADIMKKLK